MKAFMKSIVLFMEIFSPVIIINIFFIIYMLEPTRDEKKRNEFELAENYSRIDSKYARPSLRIQHNHKHNSVTDQPATPVEEVEIDC